ncbi:hypothetical protein Sjap_012017 [Stephania japonica]|uniref:Uncharacterized protein n=1 Tax=Stephania japonica TaxID=461633 RepID=A0AAP0P7X3_9MAGN
MIEDTGAENRLTRDFISLPIREIRESIRSLWRYDLCDQRHHYEEGNEEQQQLEEDEAEEGGADDVVATAADEGSTVCILLANPSHRRRDASGDAP